MGVADAVRLAERQAARSRSAARGCFDCKRLECTRCIVNGVNRHAWLADLCDDLPASYQVDWVRPCTSRPTR